ncbi:MAG: hypothetical protein ACT4OI_03685, partial [Methanobacteriota archaeon]
RWVYATYFLGSAVFLLGLAVIGYVVQSAFDRRVRDVNSQIQEARTQTFDLAPEIRVRAPAVEIVGRGPDDDDATITELVRLESDLSRGLSDGGETLVLLESRQADAVAASASQDRLVRQRESLRLRQEFIVRFLGGPAVAASVVLSVSGALLPGSDAFLQTYHQVNTAFVLGFAYSWPGIGAYVVASIWALVSSLRTERKKSVA